MNEKKYQNLNFSAYLRIRVMDVNGQTDSVAAIKELSKVVGGGEWRRRYRPSRRPQSGQTKCRPANQSVIK
jgi:hypothetical protein